jgi:hypothetical protein
VVILYHHDTSKCCTITITTTTTTTINIITITITLRRPLARYFCQGCCLGT